MPAMLDAIIAAEAQGAVAHVIACFDDPGLDAARAVAMGPVIGLCEAALIAAGRIAKRFSVVTTLPRAVPIIEDLGDRYGCGRALCAVHAADIPVLDLEFAPVQTLPLIARKIRQSVEEDRAEAVVLGCAGMSAHLEQLGRDAGVPVAVLHGDRDLTIWFPWARQAAEDADGTLVRIEGGGHSWLLEDADSLPAIIATLVEGPLTDALDAAAASIDDLYGPEALARTLDRSRSKPYQLVPRHRWRLESR